MSHSPKGEIRAAIPWVLGAVVTMAVLSTIWWALLDPDNDVGVNALTIRDGTAAKITAGEATFGLPSRIVIVPSGELLVTNSDVVQHSFAGEAIPAGESINIVLDGKEGEITTSAHASGSIAFTVTGRGSLFVTVVVPTLFFGLPIGVIIAFAVSVGRRVGASYESSA